MRWALGLAAVAATLLVGAVSAADTYVATLSTSDVTGTITFTEDQRSIDVNIDSLSERLVGKALWHINEFPAGSDQTACGVTGNMFDNSISDPTPPYELGNLSGRHGNLVEGTSTFSDDSFAAPTAFIGRSLVVLLDNGDGSPIAVACATIGTTPATALVTSAETVSTSTITFPLLPRAVQLPGATSSLLQWRVQNTGPDPTPPGGFIVAVLFDNNCGAANRGVFKNFGNFDFTDNAYKGAANAIDALYLYGRSFGIATQLGTGEISDVLQCVNFVAHAPPAEPVRQFGAVLKASSTISDFLGDILFQAISDTEVMIITRMNSFSVELTVQRALWHVHEFAATPSGSTVCGDDVTGGHWDPTFKGSASSDEVGNLSGRHGHLLPGVDRAYIDTVIGTDLFGPRGISGRSIVAHYDNAAAQNPRAACMTIGATPGYGFRATLADASLTVTTQPRLFQVPGASAAYLQFSGVSSAATAPQIAVLDATVCPSAGAAAVPLVTFGPFSGASIVSAPDVALYHGRVLALLASDNTVVVCSALTITRAASAPASPRDYTQPKYTATISGGSYGGSVSFQRVSNTEVLISADITSTAESGPLGWTVNELPYYGAAAGCAATGSAWNPAGTTPALGALGERFRPLVPSSLHGFSDTLLLQTNNFAGLTLALRDASGVVVACGLIGEAVAADFAVAALPEGRGRVIVRPVTGTDGVAQTAVYFLDVSSPDNHMGVITQFGTENAATLAGCTAAGDGWSAFGGISVSLTNAVASFKHILPVAIPVAYFIGRDAVIGSPTMPSGGHDSCAPFVYANPTKPAATLTPTSLRTAVAKPTLSSALDGSDISGPDLTVLFEQVVGSDAVRVFATALDNDGNGDKLPWHVHVFPVPSSGPSSGDCAGTRGHLDTTFNNAAGVGEAGDLSARHGVLDMTALDDNDMVYKAFEDTSISLDPSKINIMGRSVTVHLANSTRLSCGNILPVGSSAEPVTTAAVITGETASDIVLRVEALDSKVPGYTPSVFVTAKFENPTALAATGALGFHTYAVSAAGAGNAQCGFSATGPVVANGDLLSLLGKSVSFEAADDKPHVMQAAAVSSKLDLSALNGRSIVLRTSTNAQACVKFGAAAGTPAPAGTPADKLAHIVRLDFTDTSATGQAGLTYFSGAVLKRLTDFIASQFAANYDSFSVSSQSFFSKDAAASTAATATGYVTLATAQYGNSVSLIAVPKTQDINAAAGQGSQLVQDMSSDTVMGRFGDYVSSSRYQFSGLHQVGVQSVSGYCQNGVKDNGETGPDCGNAAVTTCPSCGNGVDCSVDSDCSSHRCSSGKCVSGNSASHTTLSIASSLLVLLACVMFA